MKRVLTSKERKEVLQPLNKDGFLNGEFTATYKHNIYKNTERDPAMKGKKRLIDSRTGELRNKRGV